MWAKAAWPKLRRCIRNARAGMVLTKKERKLLDQLHDAAKATWRMKMTVLSFRSRMLRDSMEDEGQLFDFILLWYLSGLFSSAKERELCRASCGDVTESALEQIAAFVLPTCESEVAQLAESPLKMYAKLIFSSTYFRRPSSDFEHKVRRNPYVEFVTSLGNQLMPRFQKLMEELADLEEDANHFGSDWRPRHLELPDPGAAEMVELAMSLRDTGGCFAKLLTPKPLLTHMENFRLALLHARLWLVRSDMHVTYGSSLSYGDLRVRKALLVEAESVQERSQEPIPSLLEHSQMQSAVVRQSMLEEGEKVYHMKTDDFLMSCCRWKCVGYPVIVKCGIDPKLQQGSVFQQASRMCFEEDELKEMLCALYWKETPRVVRVLKQFNPSAWEQVKGCSRVH